MRRFFGGSCAHLAQTLACLAGETSISPNSLVDCLGLGSSFCWGMRQTRLRPGANVGIAGETRDEFRDKYLHIVFGWFCNVRLILGGRRGTTCLDAWPFTGPRAPGVFRFGDNLFGSLGPKQNHPQTIGGPIRWEVNSESLVGPYFVGLPLEGCCAG